ncbi:MAG: efflux RND transporter permease subunit, partial [Pseudomonadota bacterium]
QKFSIIMTGTGVVALAGIVVNNAIVLIDTFNRLREEGVTDVRQAVLKTAAQRIRPILLTTVTTMLGLLPMALQINLNFVDKVISFGGITSIWWVQLSTAIISGLAFSTLLTLFFIPVMLAMPSNVMRVVKFRSNRQANKAQREEEENRRAEEASRNWPKQRKPLKGPVAPPANDPGKNPGAEPSPEALPDTPEARPAAVYGPPRRDAQMDEEPTAFPEAAE